jgi:hypothetical protein
MWEMRDAYEILFGKREEMRLLRRPSCRWEDNIIVDHREIGSGLNLSGSG